MMKKLELNRPENRAEVKPLKKEINYFLDSERYDRNEYCGICSINIAIKTRFSGTKYEQDLGDGQAYKCEICDEINLDDKTGPVFHRNCPCFCFECSECGLNILEDDESELVGEKCEYGNHQEQRKSLLERLGIDEDEEAEA